MKKVLFLFYVAMFSLGQVSVHAQMKGLHGDIMYHKSGLHAGNQFRTTFYNDATFGQINSPPDIAGEWPINSGHIYMMDGNVFVHSEVPDKFGNVHHIHSTNTSCRIAQSTGDQGPDGEWWTFLPLPGFDNPDQDRIAMSKWKDAWPPSWPDKFEDAVDPGWPGKWNGYFGKDVLMADEESYFVADDYTNREFAFYPDTTDTTRRGLAMRIFVRGFQWSNSLVEDALFVLYDIENIGTFHHDKMNFAYKFGNNMGDTRQGGDGGDDMGAFNKDEDVAYLYDYDDIGYGGWTPIGYFGGAFLESPGNPYDGIYNDNDGINGSGPTINEAMFTPVELRAGDDIVLINYKTFTRITMQMPSDTLKVHYQDIVIKYWPGKMLEEISHNLIDDNLNGIIDENNGAVFGDSTNQIVTYQYITNGSGVKYVNYITGEGRDNPLLDERRDDGRDNDGDWSAQFDDLGADGAPFTNDPGEKDGMPTLGEPHFDKTDIDETDMIGLSAFVLYKWENIPHYDDEKVWEATVPGAYDNLMENENIELLYGSGYFPSAPGEVQRFSMGILCGINLDDFMTNKYWIAKAYNENYNFSKAPTIPTLTAIPGNNRVTLIWDDMAEKSVDHITGMDFEGYRIYRSTDPGWGDMLAITDGSGSQTYRKPLAQFDLDNDYEGYHPIPIKGIQFDLGKNTGLVHTWTDTTVKNGTQYYYAVTAYDHGDKEKRIPPTECAKFISIATSGEVEKGSNVVIVRPEAPSAGYIPPGADQVQLLEGGTADGVVYCIVIQPDSVRDGHTYQITFEDTLVGTQKNIPATKNFTLRDMTTTLRDMTTGQTLLARDTLFHDRNDVPVVNGFKLAFRGNPAELAVDTSKTYWNRGRLNTLSLAPFRQTGQETRVQCADLKIVFGEIGIDSTVDFYRGSALIPAAAVNFREFQGPQCIARRPGDEDVAQGARRSTG